MDAVHQDKESLGLKTIIVYYLIHWRLFAFAFVISCVLAGAYLFLYPRTYEMRTSILIQEDKSLGSAGFNLGEAAGIMKSFGLGGNMVGSINVENELGILYSTDLFSKMVQRLGLNVSYVKPYSLGYKLYSTTPVKIVPDSVAVSMLGDKIGVKIQAKQKGKVDVKVECGSQVENYTFTSLPAQINYPICPFTLDFTSSYREGNAFKINATISPVTWVAEDLIDGFLIEEYSTTSSVIDISCTDYERERGLDMLRVLVDEYNKRAQSISEVENNKSIAFLDERIASLVEALLKKEMELEQYKLKNQITNVEYDMQFYAENMKELQTKLIEFEAQRNIINLLISYIKDPSNKYNLIPSLLSGAGSEGESNPVGVYNEALLERARIIQSSKDNNPLVDSWNDKVDKLRESVYLSIMNAKDGLDITISDLKSKEKVILDKLGNVPTYEREYIDIQRQCEVYQGMYLILLQKREEIALSNEQSRPRAQIVNAAYVKQRSIAPRKLYAGLAVMFLTIFLPVSFLFCKEQYIAIRNEYKRLN